MATADLIFKDMITTILEKGVSTEGTNVRPKWKDDGKPAHTIAKFGIVNRYDLSKEFPAPTLRPNNLKACVDEILWIWQKKSNNVHDLNSHIWDQWADEDGSIGKAYGYQVANQKRWVGFLNPNSNDQVKCLADQTDYLLHELTHNPSSRRIIANLYTISDVDEMNLHPCCYSITLQVEGRKLNMILNQRSQDLIVAGAWNVVQYAILLHMFAQSTGYEVGEMIHVIADCHIYDRHVPIAQELLQRPVFPAPKLWINPKVKSFYDFTIDDFELVDYIYNPQIKNIPVAV